MRRAVAPCVVIGVLMLAPAGDAHKGITSKFTYNADVHPVFLNRCGRCHIDGGVGPMSLLKYEDAFPWAESLRAELLTATEGIRMISSRPRIGRSRRASSDIVLDWATGGTPEGDKALTPPTTSLRIGWTAGHPNLIAQMPNRYHMNVTALEATHESALPVPTPTPVTVGRLDFLPGNAAIVRSAVLSLRSPDGTSRALGTWVPRQVPAPIALKPPVRIDPGSQIVLRTHYKKTWKHEGQPMSDLSLVGLYVD